MVEESQMLLERHFVTGWKRNVPAPSKPEGAKEKASKDDRSEAPTIALVNAEERPIRDGFKDEPILAPRSGPPYVPEHAPKQGQVKWKTLLLTQPPVTDITIRAPESQVAIHYWKNSEVSMEDLLEALEDLRNEWPDRWPDPIRRGENGRGGEEVEFELALPLMGKDGEPAKRENGNAVWRALKTRLRCRIAEEVTTVDPKVLSKSPPLPDLDM
ncbi:hypothetical protein KC328_g18489 [Hortaea werneckii]|nr:hypothetical protein KC328_g18489 [Hortaea werneckii]